MNIQDLMCVVIMMYLISLETHHRVTINLETSHQVTNPVRDLGIQLASHARPHPAFSTLQAGCGLACEARIQLSDVNCL